MSCKARRFIAFFAAMAFATAFSGCRNPFLPSADIQVDSINFLGDFSELQEMPVFAATTDLNIYQVKVSFWLRNKIDVKITSVNIFYTDLAGNPVTVYATTGGRTMKLQSRLYAPTNYDATTRTTPDITLLALDRRVFDALLDPTLTPKYILCTMTFRGEDDNGYDVKLSTQFTIKGYNF